VSLSLAARHRRRNEPRESAGRSATGSKRRRSNTAHRHNPFPTRASPMREKGGRGEPDSRSNDRGDRSPHDRRRVVEEEKRGIGGRARSLLAFVSTFFLLFFSPSLSLSLSLSFSLCGIGPRITGMQIASQSRRIGRIFNGAEAPANNRLLGRRERR